MNDAQNDNALLPAIVSRGRLLHGIGKNIGKTDYGFLERSRYAWKVPTAPYSAAAALPASPRTLSSL